MSTSGASPGAARGRELRADCSRCAGLCCVAPAFSASADFAVDKAAGKPCHHLQPDFRCDIHAELGRRGYRGCAVFDCFGAGQHVTQVTFGGRDWRGTPRVADQMFSVFTIMRQLHELLWYLTDALTRDRARSLQDDLRRALEMTEHLTRSSPDDLVGLDLAAHRDGVSALLLRTSELVRAGTPAQRPAGKGTRGIGRVLAGADLRGANLRGADLVGRVLAGADLRGANLRGADLVGRDLAGADLRGANLRGAYLIGADLRGADLRTADLIGADLRAAELGGADLTGSLFLTQFQTNAANGDHATKLPAPLTCPPHWAPAPTSR